MDGVAVIGGVDDADIAAGKLGQVIIASQLLDVGIAGEEVAQRDGVGFEPTK